MTSDLPFSRPIGVLSLPAKGSRVALKPTSSELADIARFLELPSIQRFEGEFELISVKGGVTVTGQITAELQQICVVSLEPFWASVAEEIDARFAPEDRLGPFTRKEVERTFDDEDPPEPIINGAIDIGALAVEALALGLDPFPRKPDVELPETAVSAPEASPFAALAALKKTLKG